MKIPKNVTSSSTKINEWAPVLDLRTRPRSNWSAVVNQFSQVLERYCTWGFGSFFDVFLGWFPSGRIWNFVSFFLNKFSWLPSSIVKHFGRFATCTTYIGTSLIHWCTHGKNESQSRTKLLHTFIKKDMKQTLKYCWSNQLFLRF